MPRYTLIPLRDGEIHLIRRALRYYAHAERAAIDLAVREGNHEHIHDVKRQVEPRIAATEDLMDRLLRNPTLNGVEYTT